jgi:DNA-3-methyladenine glycosylase II
MESQAKSYLSGKDPHLARIISSIPEPANESREDVFYDLVSCIVGQQIHYRRVVPTFKKFLLLLPDSYPTPENITLVDEKACFELRIAGSKYQTLLQLAAVWGEHKLAEMDWQSQSDEAIRTLLGGIKGIGNWTIDMILMYTLNRPDVFAFEDYHLKQIMVKIYGLNPDVKLKAQMNDIANDWAPFRSLASKYLLAWKDFNQKQ